ncbi:MAG TPA: beta-ketoacyl synthase N-terminal-like domain-containing protein [Acidimicrobiales bacterium]
MTTTAADTTTQLQRALATLKELRSRLEHGETARTEPIAIIGMGCRLPGAPNPHAYWELLRGGGDAVTETPPDRWDADALYDPDPEARGTVATRWGGFLDGIDRFDAAFFGISPREAAQMDPQQRLLLEVAWEALEDGGQRVGQLTGSATGVFVGLHSHSDDYYSLQAADPRHLDLYSGTGTSHSVVSGRLSYLFDWRGPSLAVDTACSSSLVAVHLAVQSLRNHECSLALAGGVNTIIEPTFTMVASRMRMMSATGRCRPFDAAADGFVRSEGCAAVVLKRLSDAVADGDRILAVIKGSAVNQDGRSNGLTAPNSLSQEAVIRAALANAGLSPSAIGMIEAHGTGTPLGDPIELEALTAVFGGDDGPTSCALGSAKANIGHTEGAAGVAALVKTVLTLRAGEIPPLVHFETLNPHISLAGTPFVIPTAPRPWPSGAASRYAGVSSFGWSGTNAHVVVGEAPAPLGASGTQTDPVVLPISARSEDALRQLAEAYRDQAALTSPTTLAQLCATAALRRSHHDHRLAVAGRTADDIVGALDAYLAGEEHTGLAVGRADGRRRDLLVIVFPGQGAQWPGMGRQLLAAEPVFRASIEACDAALSAFVDWSLIDVLTADDPAWLERIDVVQPVLFGLQVALARTWEARGVTPDAVVGHSMGEVAAAHVAGVLSLDDAARVICLRSALLRRVSGRGAMAVVGLGLDDARRAIAGRDDRLAVAVSNSRTSTVLSGDQAALDEVMTRLEADGVFCRRVKVDVASHSPQVDELRAELVDGLSAVRPEPGAVPFVSTVSGAIEDGSGLDAAYWARNLRQPVLFADAVAHLVATGHARFIELGPHPALLSAVRETLDDAGRPGTVVASMRRDTDEAVTLHTALGALHADGYPVDWTRLYDRADTHAELPSYPWQRERLWLEPAPVDPRGRRGVRADPLLGWRVPVAGDRAPLVWENHLDGRDDPVLFEHRIGDVPSLPAAAVLELMRRAAGDAPVARLTDVRFERLLVLDDDDPTVIQVVCGQGPTRSVSVHRRAGTDWIRHATATIARPTASAPPPPMDRTRIDAVRSTGTVRPGAALYDELRSTGVALGPDLRGIGHLWSHGDEHVAHLVPTPAGPPFAALDAGLQVASLATGTPLVPVSARAIEIFGPACAAATACVRFAPSADGDAAAARHADVVVYDDAGHVAVAVEGLVLRPLGHVVERVDDWCYGIEWRPAPEPEPRTDAVATWLLVGGPAPLTDALAAELRATGAPCLVADDSRASVAALGADAEVVFLGGLAAGAEPESAADLEDAQRLGSGALVHLVRELAATGTVAPVRVVTQGVPRVGGADGGRAVAQSPLWGLGRAIGEELPELWGGLIDLDPDHDTATAARSLARELAGIRGDDEVARRGDQRFVARLARRPVEPRTLLSFRPDGSYLVTGGFGALGEHVAEWLVAEGARRVVLIGRTELPSRSAWSAVDADTPAGRRIATVQRLERAGAAVHVGAVDVGDAAALTRFLDEFRAEGWPPIRGVFHTAAIFSGDLIADLEPAALLAQLRPKMIGAWTLAEQLEDLDHFVLFSSIAALLPMAGQAAYAAGNAFLDALANRRAALGRPGLSVGWGFWDGSGGVGHKDAARVMAEARGLRGFRPEQGLDALARLLAGPEPHAVIVPVDWAGFRAAGAGRPLPLVSELVEAAPAPTSDGSSARTLAERFRAAAADERDGLVERTVRRLVCRVLKLPEARLDATQPFGNLGLDSLMAIELRNRLEVELGVKLAASTAWNYPTLQELTAFARQRLEPGEDAPAGSAEASTPSTSDRAGVTAAVAALSDDEALLALMGGER